MGYLLPGQALGRSRNPLGAGAALRTHGLPVLTARNTAMIEAVTDLPPIIVADMFGVNPSTANRWASYANDSWTHYLAARDRQPPLRLRDNGSQRMRSRVLLSGCQELRGVTRPDS
ncbi:hypothetical protein [Streptomyces sp. NPDC055287]